MEQTTWSALSMGQRIKDRTVGCAELAKEAVQRIKDTDPAIHAMITVAEEQSVAQAEAVQARLDGGEDLSPLAGVPVVLKDNICTAGMPTTCGSRMLAEFTPPYDATVVQRLQAAGMVVVGKANMDEFAMGGSTETSYFGPARNPWDVERVPGGSSGGSAAAVAAGQVPLALGSDTGGSIRQPCSFCGVSGIKPTYGAVSRYGLVAYASSLDQMGPIGATIQDCAAMLSAISGRDPRDATSVLEQPLDFSTSFDRSVEGLRIGIPRDYFGQGLDDDVGEAVLAAAKQLEQLGAVVSQCDLPLVEYAVPAYYIIACAEASSNLSRYDGVKYGFRAEAETLEDLYLNSRSQGFGGEVKRRILLGSFVLSAGYYDAYYRKAMETRARIGAAFGDLLKDYDMLLSPCAPTTAYKLGEHIHDPIKMYLGDIYTVSVNLAGLPAVSVPCGFGKNGMPVGMQLIGRAVQEPLLVQAAHVFQIHTDYHLQRPKEVAR